MTVESIVTGPDDFSGRDPVMAEMTLANEFASVIVRKLATRNGERLEITSRYFGSSTRLDALQLEGLSWQDTEFFSQALRGSRGPVPPNHDDV